MGSGHTPSWRTRVCAYIISVSLTHTNSYLSTLLDYSHPYTHTNTHTVSLCVREAGGSPGEGWPFSWRRETDRQRVGGGQRSVRNDGAQPRLCQLNLERKGEKKHSWFNWACDFTLFCFFPPATHRTDGSAALFWFTGGKYLQQSRGGYKEETDRSLCLAHFFFCFSCRIMSMNQLLITGHKHKLKLLRTAAWARLYPVHDRPLLLLKSERSHSVLEQTPSRRQFAERRLDSKVILQLV